MWNTGKVLNKVRTNNIGMIVHCKTKDIGYKNRVLGTRYKTVIGPSFRIKLLGQVIEWNYRAKF